MKKLSLAFLFFFLLLFSSSFKGVPAAQATDETGWRLPTVASEVDKSGISWSDINNVKLKDGDYAQAQMAFEEESNYIKATGFGFSVPAGVTITGIAVRIRSKASDSEALNIRQIQLLKGGSVYAGGSKNNEDFWLTEAEEIILGNSVSLWSNTWLNTDVNSADFGLYFDTANFNIEEDIIAYVDSLEINVYYTSTSAAFDDQILFFE